MIDELAEIANMQQRYYDPGIGRFLSVDPVTASQVNGGNLNRYWYAANNPYRYYDPDGRQKREKQTRPPRDRRSICDRQPQRCQGYRSSGGSASSRTKADQIGPNGDAATAKYSILHARVATDAQDSSAVLALSDEDIGSVSDYMVMLAKRDTKHRFMSDKYESQFAGFDTFLYKSGLAVRQFNVAGIGIAYGGDINYIGVGALIAAYGHDRSAVAPMVVAWNLNNFSQGQGPHNIGQIWTSMPWALRGYDDYTSKSKEY